MTELPLAVVKIGGSLLDLDDLIPRLRRWQASRTHGHEVWISGGGRPVDEVRARHAAQALDDDAAHWAAIELMAQNARSLANELSEVPIRRFAMLHLRTTRPGTTLLDVVDFMRDVEPVAPGCKLPASWDVTSDSIAARAAVVLKASELVLFKSATPPVAARSTLAELANHGYVDRFLPQLAEELPSVTLINFRRTPPPATVRR